MIFKSYNNAIRGERAPKIITKKSAIRADNNLVVVYSIIDTVIPTVYVQYPDNSLTIRFKHFVQNMTA